jgi:aspartyl-tRNA(Asn)/glutamyl-tRNA(Gln) amidotransferase subunit B
VPIYDGYEAVIGLEVHAQLMTQSKMFCGCQVGYREPPNSLTCPVCLGLPGALPALNKKAVEFAMRAILATGGTIQKRSVFARKNYFYPDLPKGYQISQYDRPVGVGGEVRYHDSSGVELACRLIRIHLEEDAGKSLHPEKGEGYSRVDLNRCGTPLIEIVSEADIRSPENAYSYLTKLKQTLQYLEVCSGDMEKGHLRCDANVSVRPAGQAEYGTRTEVKNMNSFKGVERALRFEIERQVNLLKSGGEVVQETLLWDEKRQVAAAMRSKEESHDYRYFPEPDLVNLVVSDEWIEESRRSLPELPEQKAARFMKQYGVRPYDAAVLTESRTLADYFEETVSYCDDSTAVSNWLQTEVLGVINQTGEDIGGFKVRPKMIAELLNLVRSGAISGKIAKTVFEEMTQTGKEPSVIIGEQGLAQISDDSALIPVVDKVLADNQESVAKFKAGRNNVFGFLVGQVMKATRGQANPELVNRLLKERLGE